LPYPPPRFSITRSLTWELLTEDWIRFEKAEPKYGCASYADYGTVIFRCDLTPNVENIFFFIIRAHISSHFLMCATRNDHLTFSCPRWCASIRELLRTKHWERMDETDSASNRRGRVHSRSWWAMWPTC
jgi:hypothetical protein